MNQRFRQVGNEAVDEIGQEQALFFLAFDIDELQHFFHVTAFIRHHLRSAFPVTPEYNRRVIDCFPCASHYPNGLPVLVGKVVPNHPLVSRHPQVELVLGSCIYSPARQGFNDLLQRFR